LSLNDSGFLALSDQLKGSNTTPRFEGGHLHQARQALIGPKSVSRRKYLKYVGIAALGVSGSAIALWGPWKQSSPYVPEVVSATQTTGSTIQASTSTNVPTTASVTTTVKETPTLPSAEKSLVSVVRGNSDAQIEAMVQKSVDTIGGIGKFITSGQRVVVKPPVLTSDKACTPDPRVVAAIVRLAKDAGGKVAVAESSGNGDTGYNLSKVGITAAAQDAGAEVINLQTEKAVQVTVPNGVLLKQVETFPTIRDCDVLISVPRLKRHSATLVTISLKNMMGTLPPSGMQRLHTLGLSQCIGDLNTVIRPHLTVVDASYAMTRTGPTGGDLTRLDTILASSDPVAADTIAARELQALEERIGVSSRFRFDAANVAHIRAAADLQVGKSNLDDLEIVEVTLS
jgi:uncharacterized protein (DUF362 family)